MSLCRPEFISGPNIVVYFLDVIAVYLDSEINSE